MILFQFFYRYIATFLNKTLHFLHLRFRSKKVSLKAAIFSWMYILRLLLQKHFSTPSQPPYNSLHVHLTLFRKEKIPELFLDRINSAKNVSCMCYSRRKCFITCSSLIFPAITFWSRIFLLVLFALINLLKKNLLHCFTDNENKWTLQNFCNWDSFKRFNDIYCFWGLQVSLDFKFPHSSNINFTAFRRMCSILLSFLIKRLP